MAQPRLPCSGRMLLALLFLLKLGGTSGCGPGGPELSPVVGKVTVHGKPLTTGAVSFRPDAARGNSSQHHPTGEIDAAGNYELFTVGRRGAPPGWYKVLVFADENQASAESSRPAMPRWLVHVKYTSEQTTDLAIEVAARPTPGGYDLKLSK